MLFWIFAALTVYYLGLFLPSLFLMPRIGLAAYAGSRDEEPTPAPMHGRALRAHANLRENMIAFGLLASLVLIVPEADVAAATTGAMVFVLARAVYLPLYLFAVPWLRSTAWTVGFIGLVMMALALI